MFKEEKITGSNIPAIEYNFIQNCIWDMSKDTRKHLKSFHHPKNRYNGIFTFYLRYTKKIILVIRCNENFIQAEAFKIIERKSIIYDVIDVDIKELDLRPRIAKAIELICSINGDRKQLSKRMFNKIVKLLYKTYHERTILKEYNDKDLYKLLYRFYKEVNINQYTYIKT